MEHEGSHVSFLNLDIRVEKGLLIYIISCMKRETTVNIPSWISCIFPKRPLVAMISASPPTLIHHQHHHQGGYSICDSDTNLNTWFVTFFGLGDVMNLVDHKRIIECSLRNEYVTPEEGVVKSGIFLGTIFFFNLPLLCLLTLYTYTPFLRHQ